MKRAIFILALALLAVAFTLVPRAALAADEPEAFARVETLAIDGRLGGGFWLRIVLPDGRVAYALGDEVQTFAVRPGEPDAPSRPGLFATPPLEGARAGLAIVGGVLSIPIADGSTKAFGYLEARPSIVVHRTVTLDGFIGDALTADGAQILYGGGATINFAPSWPSGTDNTRPVTSSAPTSAYRSRVRTIHWSGKGLLDSRTALP